jgi:SAM-dependent methyltransferase
MIPLFLQNDADAVFGSRFLSSEFKRALFFRHALGNNLLTFLCNLASDLSLTDMETCYKMVRTRLLQSIPLESSDFRIEPELTIKLAKRGAIVFEVPISYSGRTYQEGKKINWRDGVRALGAILKYRVSDRLYTEDHPSGAMSLRLSRAPRFMRWIGDMVRPFLGERVLEIGAGIGNLTVHLIPRTLYWATDRDSLCVDQLRKLQSVRPYLRVSSADAIKLDPALAEQQFDTVVCCNVIEKVEDDVAALRSIRDVLSPGGRTVVLVPRGAGLYGSLDRTLGHCRRYSPEQLSRAGEQAGFRVCEVRQFNRAGTPAWWLNGRVLQRKTIGIWQIKLLNLLVPVLRRVDRWLPFPALSLMIVFENKSPGST